MPNLPDDPIMAQRLARLLRHEMGDLLQSVYGTVAILLDRLPPSLELERRLLDDLRARAELGRMQLDGIIDLVCQDPASTGIVHLEPLVALALRQLRPGFPQLVIDQASDPGIAIVADPRLFAAAMTVLLQGMCQGARNRLVVRLRREPDAIRCEIERDGFPVPADQALWLEHPFATNRQASFGLALALIQRASLPGGGTVRLGNRDGGGVQVLLVFPVVSSPASSDK